MKANEINQKEWKEMVHHLHRLLIRSIRFRVEQTSEHLQTRRLIEMFKKIYQSIDQSMNRSLQRKVFFLSILLKVKENDDQIFRAFLFFFFLLPYFLSLSLSYKSFPPMVLVALIHHCDHRIVDGLIKILIGRKRKKKNLKKNE